MITTAWVVPGAGEIPVPSGAVPAKVNGDWSFIDVDELAVKSVVGRDEELESLGPDRTCWSAKGGDEVGKSANS